AGDDIDLIHCGEASDVIDGFRDLTAHDRSDGDGRRRGRALRRSEGTGCRDAKRAHEDFPSKRVGSGYEVLLAFPGHEVLLALPGHEVLLALPRRILSNLR